MIGGRGCHWKVVLLAWMAGVCAGMPSSHHHHNHHQGIAKRSVDFDDLECKGIYDPSIFAKVDVVCRDCYDLYHDAGLHMKCRKDCFTTRFYFACGEALLKTHSELEELRNWIKQLHGAPTGL